MLRARHLVIAAALTFVPPAAGAVAIGCVPSIMPTTAIAAAQAVVQTASTVVADAQAVWPIVLASIPAAQQPAAQDGFNKAVFAAHHAILALDDAIQAAITANTPNPDFTAIFGQVADAVAQVVSIVQSFQGSSAGAHTAAINDMISSSARLKALSVKK